MKKDVYNFIAVLGFRTESEILANFTEPKEILMATIELLLKTNKIRRVQYLSPTGNNYLLYVIPK